jgi:hypothetical protein
MIPFFTIIKSDYLQRTRSYAFLITLCVSLATAYTFIPEPNANYSTIRVDDYIGYYNSAWFGYVTAIMTSIFLSLIGFYLVNSGIKKDIDTKVGQIVATTPISNFKYLLSKVLSNFLLLSTIVAMVFIMSILLFILYNDGFSFELFQFVKPYLLITLPALFFISMLAVVFEVFLGKYSVLQNVGFFFLFSALMVFSPKTQSQFFFDVFGSKIVMHHLEEKVRDITNSDAETNLSVGYVLGHVEKAKKFEFNGIDFPTSFIISRFVWGLFGIGIIAIISIFFHRFDRKEHLFLKNFITAKEENEHKVKDLVLSSLPIASINYKIAPLVKTELLLLFRIGKKWLWIINIVGMILLAVLPITIAHQIGLPILWFLQVNRLSNLTTKELTNKVHYFAFSSYKPITRLLSSQLFAAVILMFVLSLPLTIRHLIAFDYSASISVFFRGIFIVLLAALLGVLSKGKKLFEVLFFMIAYANINGVLVFDYFGGFEHQAFYVLKLAVISLILGSLCAFVRTYQLKS